MALDSVGEGPADRFEVGVGMVAPERFEKDGLEGLEGDRRWGLGEDVGVARGPGATRFPGWGGPGR
ncbi:MAG: hypothetical protein C4303_07190, partial [candidate division GAL15 bacterium]